MRTRNTSYYDRLNDQILHGIEVHIQRQWVRYAEDGQPFLSPDIRVVETKRAQLCCQPEFQPKNVRLHVAGPE